MPSRQSELSISIISNGNEIRDALQRLKEEGGLSYRTLLRRMIEEVSTNERLRKRVIAFHKEDPHDFGDTVQRGYVRIGQSAETRALASALAFQICGSGRISEVSRLLVRFYAKHADKADLYTALERANKRSVSKLKDKSLRVVPIPPWRKLKTGAVTKVAKAVTLDHESDALLDKLVKIKSMRRMELVSQLIESWAVNEKHLDDFGRSPDLREGRRSAEPVILRRFNFTPQVDTLLKYMSYRAIGKVQRSAVIRALIKIEAGSLGLRKPSRRGLK